MRSPESTEVERFNDGGHLYMVHFRYSGGWALSHALGTTDWTWMTFLVGRGGGVLFLVSCWMGGR